MSDIGYLPFAAAAGVALLAYVHRRLLHAAQPLRLEMAKKGEALLADRDFPPDLKLYVEALLASAFSQRGTLLGGIFLIPVVALFIVFSNKLPGHIRAVSKLKPKLKSDFYEFGRLHDRITLANHPLLLPLVELQLVLFIPLAIVVRGLKKGRLPVTADRDTVMAVIESGRLRNRFKAAA